MKMYQENQHTKGITMPEMLTLETIPEVGHGAVAIAVNKALRTAYLDLQDRPNVTGARKVSLEIHLTPITDGGHLVSVGTRFTFNTKVPERSTMEFRMKAARDGISFMPDAPDNPDQKSLLEEAE